jgi:hypothetical protein
MINHYLIHFLQKGFIYFILIFLPFGFLSARQSERKIETKRGELIRFAKQKNANWVMEKRKADSIAMALDIPVAYIENDSRVVILQRFGYNNKPVYYATDNIVAAAIISVDQLWTNDNDYPSLAGEGMEINLWDGGAVLTTHQEFQNGPGARVVMRDTELPLSNHSTHIAGTMIATGINEDARGMAGKATIKGWDLNDDIAEMASSAADGIVLSNHSYGPLRGWYYNTDNESWYWYGDPAISPVEDYEFGLYDQVSADLDFIAWNAPDYLIVKSAGNDRNDTPTSSFVHYVWSGTWTLVNVEREPDGGTDGFDCLSPMAVAKNVLTVGAVDDAKAMTAFSAYGPTDDGRIKPDVVANGYSVYSSTADSNKSYGVYNGTSMSTASATGSVALLQQLQNILRPGVPLLSSTVKAVLIHTASEAGASLGPDYSFGWGLLNIKAAADMISQNSENGGRNIYEGVISEGEIITIPVETVSAPLLKVTLCWTDPSGQPSSPSLNSRTSKLINDLDVKVENSVSLQSFLPWVLDVENPASPATNGINHIDNVEQVYIANPGENNFNIKISHSGSLTGGSQSFSLIVSGTTTPTNIFPPQNLGYSINGSTILLNWNPPADGTPLSYKIYRNGQVLAETPQTYYSDQAIILNNVYEYYVTAVYDFNNEQIESVGTNRVTVFPQTLRPLPFNVDFEIEPTEVIIKNNEAGWQWGDSESLNCYYLDFSDNATKFIGIDSHSAGEAVHVTDVAATAPLLLGEYDNIVLSFDYLLKTGIYDAIDELHVVYKMQDEEEWHDLENMESSFDWKYESIELPEEICKNGTQIGFYFDDFYQWGMGAGLDNIEILGTPVRSFDLSLNSMVSPLSACSLSADENVIVAIRNAGTQAALPGDIINVRMDLSTGISVNDNIVLTEALNSDAILSHQMSAGVDLSAPGNYLFDFTLSSALDLNPINDQMEFSVEVYGFPTAQILNADVDFCFDEPQVPVQVSPTGGTLSGPGISGLYFNPAVAGAGSHTITYSYADQNGCDASVTRLFVVNALPQPAILNSDITFCIDEPSVIVQVSPTGGTLSGPGISGLFFNPAVAGVGSHTITYSYTDPNGCTATVEKQIIIIENPVVNIGPDQIIHLDDTIQLIPTGNGVSFLWHDGSTNNNLIITAGTFGIGLYDIWVMATSLDFCSSTDSMKLTINGLDHAYSNNAIQDPLVYPNPFKKGFYLKIDESETLKDIALYGQDGVLYLAGIPGTFPYFNGSNFPSGFYVLKIKTKRRIYVLQIIKS